MNTTHRNPVIRVTSETRQNLKIIAAHTGETMQDVVARIAKQERERIQEGGNRAQSVQVPNLSEERDCQQTTKGA